MAREAVVGLIVSESKLFFEQPLQPGDWTGDGRSEEAKRMARI
jgi:hypothetical protein